MVSQSHTLVIYHIHCRAFTLNKHMIYLSWWNNETKEKIKIDKNKIERIHS